MRGSRGPVFAAVLCALAVLPPAASGAGGPSGLLRLAGSGGYRVEIWASRKGVTLTASRRHAAVSYLSEGGRATADGIEARFGDLGRVDVDFRPTDGCLGYYVGRISFRGERGFTRVRARRARGGFSPYAGACRGRPAPTHARRSAAGAAGRCLEGISLRRGGFVVFHAGRGAFARVSDLFFPRDLGLERLDRPGTPFSAFTLEIGHGMLISRGIAARGREPSFQIGADPLSARVSPPAPFSGSGIAIFPRSRPMSWGGTLRASFPGRPSEALTGKKGLDDVRLRRGPACSRAT